MRRALHSAAGSLAIYLLLSLVFFGRPLVHGERAYIGSGHDPQILIWSFSWWPHAILNGENPFLTHAVWPVTGQNMAWVASVPGLAILAAPVTLLAGPVIAFNLVTLALPAVAAWTAFLLCRYVTRSWWAALAGGYIFGFSSYMLGQTLGHMHMTSVFLVPLVALTVLQFVDGKLGRSRMALQLGALLGAQVWLSTEVFATLTVTLATSLVACFIVVPEARARLRGALPAVLGAYAIGCVLAAPLLGYALSDVESESINDPALFPADLLNVLVPTETTFLSTDGSRELSMDFLANITENGAYLGLPLVVILAWFGWQWRRRSAGRLLVVLLLLGLVAELGVALHVAGNRVVTLPWALAAELPGLIHVLPVRFSMYVSLAAAVATALWAASSRPAPLVRVALVVAATAALVPAAQSGIWQTTPTRPSFFADETYQTCFASDETVFVPDAADVDATLWQAEADFRFRLANGALSPVLPDGIPDPEAAYAVLNGSIPGSGARLVQLARDLGATTILLDDERLDEWSPPLVEAGLRPVAIGGVWLYHLRPHDPSCS